MSTYRSGRHEFGQNFLTDRATIDTIVSLVSRTEGPIIEIGAGSGALTLPLERLARPIAAIEIDPRLAQTLRGRVGALTTVVCADFLRYRLPRRPYVIVGNLPFHQTTSMLRRLLHTDAWSAAVLLTQWEVARRRAGVGGATMMTAQWWPWYEFALVGRVPAKAFTPQPGVDGGVMTVTRRPAPLVDPARRRHYQSLVHSVFTGKGRGLEQVLHRAAGPDVRRAVRKWLAEQEFRRSTLPRDLTPEQWSALFGIVDR